MVCIKFRSMKWAEREASTLCSRSKASSLHLLLPALLSRRLLILHVRPSFSACYFLHLSFSNHSHHYSRTNGCQSIRNPHGHHRSSYHTAFFLGLEPYTHSASRPHLIVSSTHRPSIISASILFLIHPFLAFFLFHLTLSIADQTGINFLFMAGGYWHRTQVRHGTA